MDCPDEKTGFSAQLWKKRSRTHPNLPWALSTEGRLEGRGVTDELDSQTSGDAPGCEGVDQEERLSEEKRSTDVHFNGMYVDHGCPPSLEVDDPS